MTEVGREANPGGMRLKNKSDRVHRIMGEGKGVDRENACLEGLAPGENPPFDLPPTTVLKVFPCQRIRKHGHLTVTKKDFQSPRVVAVLMRENNPVQGIWINPKQPKALRNLFGA